MDKYIKIERFMQQLFDEESQAKRAAEIGQAILVAQSIRLTEIAARMQGNSEASYKRIQRFLKAADPKEILWRLFEEEADFAIGDPTEIERRQA